MISALLDKNFGIYVLVFLAVFLLVFLIGYALIIFLSNRKDKKIEKEV